MKKLLYLPLLVICMFVCQGCSDDKEEEAVYNDCYNSPPIFGVCLVVTDVNGNNLLDPDVEGNIVDGEVSMVCKGKSYPLYIQGKPTDSPKAKKYLHLCKGIGWSYYLIPHLGLETGYKNEAITIHWGKGIESDKIVISGGFVEGVGSLETTITVNGQKAEKTWQALGSDTYLYKKEMP